jgi:hypothetical protein
MASAAPRFPLDLTIDRTESGYRLVSRQESVEETEVQSLDELIAKISELVGGIAWGKGRSERREAIASRAPTRDRVKALMDRLAPADEWLDDEQDWTPPGKAGD